MGDYHEAANRCVCRNPESLSDESAQLQKLRTNRPKVWFEGTVPALSLADLKRIFFDWANRWTRVCNVECSEAASRQEAHWIVVPARIDGRNGVLADMVLPGPSQQVMRIDIADSASERQLGQTIMHEVGHGYGLLHLERTPPPDVMEPILNPNLDEPQATEAKLMASMYGAPKITPVPAPAAGEYSCTISADGKTFTTRFVDAGDAVKCSIEAAKPGAVATLQGTKTWQAAAQLQSPVEQPEAWDDDTDLYPEGDLT